MSPKFSENHLLLGFGKNTTPYCACGIILYLEITQIDFPLYQMKCVLHMFSFLRTGEGSILGKENGLLVVLY